jgi:hypothetical protein
MSGTPADGVDRSREEQGSAPQPDGILNEIWQLRRCLQFGSLLISVQDGVVVQIDRTEKKRFPRQQP